MFYIINVNQIIIIILPLGKVIKFLFGSDLSDFLGAMRFEFYRTPLYCQVCKFCYLTEMKIHGNTFMPKYSDSSAYQ